MSKRSKPAKGRSSGNVIIQSSIYRQNAQLFKSSASFFFLFPPFITLAQVLRFLKGNKASSEQSFILQL